MAAYVIVDIDVTDPVLYEEYKRAAEPTLAPHGGKYVVRGGKTEVLEGARRPGRLVVLEFSSMEKAKAWYECEAYRHAKKVRLASARTEMLLVEGLGPVSRSDPSL